MPIRKQLEGKRKTKNRVEISVTFKWEPASDTNNLNPR